MGIIAQRHRHLVFLQQSPLLSHKSIDLSFIYKVQLDLRVKIEMALSVYIIVGNLFEKLSAPFPFHIKMHTHTNFLQQQKMAHHFDSMARMCRKYIL